MFACKVVAVTCLIEREMMVKKTPLFAVVRSTILSMERTWFLEALWYCTQMIMSDVMAKGRDRWKQPPETARPNNPSTLEPISTYL